MASSLTMNPPTRVASASGDSSSALAMVGGQSRGRCAGPPLVLPVDERAHGGRVGDQGGRPAHGVGVLATVVVGLGAVCAEERQVAHRLGAAYPHRVGPAG